MNEVLEGLLATSTCDMNGTLSKDFTEKELSTVVRSMAKGKTSGYDRIPIEFFQELWSIVANNFHCMVLKGFCHQKLSTLRFRPSPSGQIMMPRRNSFLSNPMYNSNMPWNIHNLINPTLCLFTFLNLRRGCVFGFLQRPPGRLRHTRLQ